MKALRWRSARDVLKPRGKEDFASSNTEIRNVKNNTNTVVIYGVINDHRRSIIIFHSSDNESKVPHLDEANCF